MSRLFGTDGIRGVAGEGLTAELAMRVGRAVGLVLSEECRVKIRAVIGADTRGSSQMLVSALKAGLYSSGADVIDVGVAPTPAVAFLTLKNECDAGIVVSASHNPYMYNGIKVFGADGFKIPDEIEERIEGLALGEESGLIIKPKEFGRSRAGHFGLSDYMEYLKGCVGDIAGIRAVIDCANGATGVTREIFSSLLKDCRFIGVEPDGVNINAECGSTDLKRLKEEVARTGADIGIAFDGDGDRCLAVDELGEEIDGDFIMAILAKRLKKEARLYKNAVVGTVMTNLGFIKFCESEGISYYSSKVGDRYVLELMEQGGYSLGGEQSGHIIIREYATTGDGQLSALMLISTLKESGVKLSELKRIMRKYPQSARSIPADESEKLFFHVDKGIREIIGRYEKEKPDARIVVRASGTEPLIRIMAEGEDAADIKSIVDGLCREIGERLSQR